ncbi:MAG: hypothetical protein AAFR73_03415 [Pseudomonadota bacterium]
MLRLSRTAILTSIALVIPNLASADAMTATKRAKLGDFDSAADVACSQELGEELGSCAAGVARDGTSAAVVVSFRNGFKRMLTFDDGAFLRGNTTMSGVGTDTEWRLEDGLYRIRVDDQRFDIPETLIAGE